MLAAGCSGVPGEEQDSACVDGLPAHPNSVTGNAYGHEHARIALSPDGALLAGGGRHRPDLVVWDTATGEQVHTFEVGTVVRPVWLGASSLCWATDEAVIVADLAEGTTRHFRVGGTGEGGDVARPQISSLSAGPDGARVALVAADGVVVVADTAECSATEPRRFPGARAVGMTTTEVVVETDGEILAFDPASGDRDAAYGDASSFAPMVWAPDASVLAVQASAGFADESRIVSAATGKQVATAAGDLVGVPQAFSVDAARLVGVHEDGTVRVWEFATSVVATVEVGQIVADVAAADRVVYVWGPDSLDAVDVDDSRVIRTFTP